MSAARKRSKKNAHGGEDYEAAVQSGDINAADIGAERALTPYTFGSWAKKNIKRRQRQESAGKSAPESLEELFFENEFVEDVLDELKRYDKPAEAERVYLRATDACFEYLKLHSNKPSSPDDENAHELISGMQIKILEMLSYTKKYDSLEAQLNLYVSGLRGGSRGEC